MWSAPEEVDRGETPGPVACSGAGVLVILLCVSSAEGVKAAAFVRNTEYRFAMAVIDSEIAAIVVGIAGVGVEVATRGTDVVEVVVGVEPRGEGVRLSFGRFTTDAADPASAS